MSVISPAHTQPREVHLHRLPLDTQLQFETLMDRADEYADHRELTASALLHADAIHLIGIRPPASGELARCTCQACYCTAVFAAEHTRTYIDGTVEFVQCEICADEHRLGNE